MHQRIGGSFVRPGIGKINEILLHSDGVKEVLLYCCFRQAFCNFVKCNLFKHMLIFRAQPPPTLSWNVWQDIVAGNRNHPQMQTKSMT